MESKRSLFWHTCRPYAQLDPSGGGRVLWAALRVKSFVPQYAAHKNSIDGEIQLVRLPVNLKGRVKNVNCISND